MVQRCRRTDRWDSPFQSGERHLDENKGDHYEYVPVDDLREPQTLSSPRSHTSSFKLKDRTYKFHLGCDFVRDEHGD
jgi:hypothetical protein